MKQVEKELIKEISNLFKDYEEKYVPEEWEKFKEIQKSNKSVLPIWIKIAAVFFVIVSFITFYSQNGQVKINNILYSKKGKNNSLKDININNSMLKKPGSVEEKNVQRKASYKVQGYLYSKAIQHATAEDKMPRHIVKNLKVQYEGMRYEVVNRSERMKIKFVSLELIKPQQDNTLNFLMSESQKYKTSKEIENASSKWNFTLGFMPIATYSAVNVGAGLNTSYELSKQFAISTGISLLSLKSGVEIEQSPINNLREQDAFSEQKQLEGTDAIIKAIDIPLALVYKLNKNFYTSAGFSYVNIIKEHRSNNYIKNSFVQNSVVDPVTGNEQLVAATVSEKIRVVEVETPLKGNSYIGFFNVSLGRRQPIFQRYDLLIEPFFKLPIGRLSKDDVRLMNTGVKIQFSF